MSRLGTYREVRLRRLKWVGSLSVIIAFILALMTWWWVTIQAPLWEERQQFMTWINEQIYTKEIVETHRFIGEEIVWIGDVVAGDDQRYFVYLNDHGIAQWYLKSEGISKSSAEEIVLERQPHARIRRIQPGWLDQRIVWEVYYTYQDAQSNRQHRLAYLRFSDGERVSTYRLNARF